VFFDNSLDAFNAFDATCVDYSIIKPEYGYGHTRFDFKAVEVASHDDRFKKI